MTPNDAWWMVIGINTALAFAQVALIVRGRRLNDRALALLRDAERLLASARQVAIEPVPESRRRGPANAAVPD
jgi:hypothetical protein